MKKIKKLLGILAFISIIGVIIIACGDDEGLNNENKTLCTHNWRWEINESSISKKVCILCNEKINGKIGDTGPAGGIIFYVADGSGGRSYGFNFFNDAADTIGKTAYYLEVSLKNAKMEDFGSYTTNNVPKMRWSIDETHGFYPVVSSVANAIEIGTGKRNTALIISVEEEVRSYGNYYVYAALFCDRYGNGTLYNDWFLPSNDELDELLRNLPFITTQVWSSSQVDSNTARAVSFVSAGYSHPHNKNQSLLVLPIRAF